MLKSNNGLYVPEFGVFQPPTALGGMRAPWGAPLTVALSFTPTTASVNHGTGASITNLDGVTIIYWGIPKVIDSTGFHRLLYKGGGFEIYSGKVNGTSGRLGYFRNRATTATDCESSDGLLVANVPTFAAFIDGNGVTPRIYTGTDRRRVTEISSYAAQTTGSGAVTNDSATALSLGGRPTAANLQSEWYISYVWIYNRVLTFGEIARHYDGFIILANPVLVMTYGVNKIGPQIDWSGRGNTGTVTDATYVQGPPMPAWGATA